MELAILGLISGKFPLFDYLLVKDASQPAKNAYTGFMQEYEILGQKIVITNPEEAELASYALHIVNDKINKIKATKPQFSPQQTAVLALLQIAGDLVKDRRSIDEYRRELDQRCSALMNEVTNVLNAKASVQDQAV
jgi:cell division protein ZapA (FtsZ GTPase activity inhibitor)